MTTADRVRDLITDAWNHWDQPPPVALTRANPAAVAAELDRRRDRALARYDDEMRAIARLEQRIADARGTLL